MINLGIALQQVRRFDEAITACEEAAAIFCETEDQHNEQIALTKQPRRRQSRTRQARRSESGLMAADTAHPPRWLSRTD